MATIEYNGYIATVEYSSDDKVFFGKIEMINDLVTFECDSAKEIEEVFKDRVDDYVATCNELNREPQKAFKGVFNVRVEPELHRELYRQALEHGKSLNSWVKELLTTPKIAKG
jgi:predicted HicB family RNase H-like nuclease